MKRCLILLLSVGLATSLAAQEEAVVVDKKETPPPSAKAEAELPTTSVQIVNATSVPTMSLSMNGQMAYPEFPQGVRAADGATPMLKVKYVAKDLASGVEVPFAAAYEKNTNQTLVFIGDFKTPMIEVPETEGIPATEGGILEARKLAKEPVLVMGLVFSHDMRPDEIPFRYRIVNGMPDRPLTIRVSKDETRVVPPGSFCSVRGQPSTTTLNVEIDGAEYPVWIRQEGLFRNCTVAFYLKEGRPAFKRAFENTKESLEARRKIQEDAN